MSCLLESKLFRCCRHFWILETMICILDSFSVCFSFLIALNYYCFWFGAVLWLAENIWFLFFVFNFLNIWVKSLEAAVHRPLPEIWCGKITQNMNRSINLCIQRLLNSLFLSSFFPIYIIYVYIFSLFVFSFANCLYESGKCNECWFFGGIF